MRCQYCNCAESKVIDSRPTEEGNSIRRRRECMGCGRRFTTYEKIEMLPLMVVKRDGRRETFDAQKIKAGILHACEKLPVSMQQIDAMTTSIEQRAYASMEGEISSQRIGDMVMEELKATNDVAYVRFAAVYRLFTDIGTFMQELQKLLDEYIRSGQLKTKILPTVKYCANLLHLSPRYFMDLLKFETGKNLDEYFQLKRIEIAKRMLSANENTVSSVAEILGFSSVQYFSNLFRKLVGVAPNEYRLSQN